MAEPIEMDVWQGEIAELEVDALVIGANESLFMTAGAAASVKRHAGNEVERAAVEQGPIAPGTAIVTSGGNLPAGYIIHAVAVGHDRIADATVLERALRAALAFAEPLQVRRIAISPLGVETGAFTAEESAAIMVRTIRSVAGSSLIESVVLAAAHAPEARALGEAMRAAEPGAPVP